MHAGCWSDSRGCIPKARLRTFPYEKMRTLVVMHESLVPPENLEGHTDKEIEEWRTEYDVTTTLRKAGHDVRCMGGVG